MLYTIVKSFSEANGDSWTSYCKWRGIQFESFDSIDGLLKPSLFEPTTKEDWNHVVNQDYMTHYITDFDYASQKHRENGKRSCLLSLSFDNHEENNPQFLGYDLIDGYFDISLLTNWGNDCKIINQQISLNGLISTYKVIKEIRDYLITTYKNDSHVDSCSIVSIYSTEYH